VQRVRIEITASLDACLDGKPKVQQVEDGNGRAHLELLFVPVSDSPECNADSNNIPIPVVVAVPIIALAIAVIVIAMAVIVIAMAVIVIAMAVIVCASSI